VCSSDLATFHGSGTCTCTVGGVSGPVRFWVFGTQSPDGARRGRIIFEGGGDLSGLVGVGAFSGSADGLPITGRLVG